MPKLTFSTITMAITMLLLSCEKDIELTQQTLTIKATTRQRGDSISYTHFIYNNDNQLSEILDSNNNGHKWTSELQYNEQGKLISVAVLFNGGPNVSYSFKYDDKGRIIQKLGLNNRLFSTYAYDEHGRLIADSSYTDRPEMIFEYLTYKYDQSDNIIEKKIFRKVTGAYQVVYKELIQYDTKQNPLYHPAHLLYFVEHEGAAYTHILSKNNIVFETSSSGTIRSYTYRYSSNNLPESFSEIDNTDPLARYCNFYY